MVIGTGRLKELRIIISGHGSRGKGLSSDPSEEEEEEEKRTKNKRRAFKKIITALKKNDVNQKPHYEISNDNTKKQVS